MDCLGCRIANGVEPGVLAQGNGFSWGEPARPHDAGKRLAETREKLVRALDGRPRQLWLA